MAKLKTTIYLIVDRNFRNHEKNEFESKKTCLITKSRFLTLDTVIYCKYSTGT
jgi:hypothetical protein